MDYSFNHDPKGGKGDMPLASDAASKASKHETGAPWLRDHAGVRGKPRVGDTPPASYTHKPKPVSELPKPREHGPREKLTVILPNAASVAAELQGNLAKAFGGFSCQANGCFGGWVDKSGNLVTEQHWRYTVSYERSEANYKRAIEVFRYYGARLNQEWLHIERSYFQAEHRNLCVDEPGS